MNVKHMQTEVEQALAIARKMRDGILFKKSSLESSLTGFYTVAQILGREEDMVWAEHELQGYFEELPKYRLKVPRIFRVSSGRQLTEMMVGDVVFIPCEMNVRAIRRTLDKNPITRTQFMVSDHDIESMTAVQKKVCKKSTGVYWQYEEEFLAGVLDFVEFELLKRLNRIIGEITYGKIPTGVLQKFQKSVNARLASSNPSAVSALNTAYENMGRSEDPERIAHVAFSCRRLIAAVADELFPAQEKEYVTYNNKPIKVGKSNTVNRLEAYVDSSGSGNRKYLIKKLDLLRDMCSKIPQSINKGIHANISNADAEMLVIYSYLILGEVVLCQDAATTKNSKPRGSKKAQDSQ